MNMTMVKMTMVNSGLKRLKTHRIVCLRINCKLAVGSTVKNKVSFHSIKRVFFQNDSTLKYYTVLYRNACRI